jgi:streptogramin lyase
MMRLSPIVLTFVLVACGGGSESSQGSAVVPTLSQLSIQKHLRIVEYSIPTASSNAIAITAGPDGNLWFAEERGNNIGRITTNGRITEYPIPTAGSEPENIIAGPDGNMWFTEYAGSSGKIGRITTNGVITEYPISSPFITPPARAIVGGIASGPGDGYIWVALLGGGGFGRITPTTGVFSVVTYEANCTNIVAGPDRNLWGLNVYGNIERITTSGTITDFPMPTRGEALEGLQRVPTVTCGSPSTATPTASEISAVSRRTA